MCFLQIYQPADRVEHLDDESLIQSLKTIAANERELRADFIIYLAEFDRRALYRPAGFSSLFAYLTEKLRFSNATAFRRVTAARLQARMPAVASYLREGRLSLTKLCHLRDLLEPDACLALLEQAASLTEKEVAELAVILDPARAKPALRDTIRPVAVLQLDLAAPPPAPASEPAAMTAAPVPPMTPPAEPPRPAELKHVLKMTVGAEFMKLLEEVKAALSNTHASPSLELVFTRCMQAELAAHARRTRAQTTHPRAPRSISPDRTRHVPADVTRNVWERDGSQCTFVSPDGHRCEERHFLHIHHEEPFAVGGPATVANLRILCAAHNELLARQDFGDAHIDKFIRRAR